MCGRFTLRTPNQILVEQFGLSADPQLTFRFNIAPTQDVAVVHQPKPTEPRVLEMMHWGLIPSWATDRKIGARMINARSETAAEKPSFRAAFKRRRCLVLADGYYEWQQLGGRHKQPYYIHLCSDRPFAMAGLWECQRKCDPPLLSCTILTTDANELTRDVHDRMPVILDPQDYDHWLDPAIADKQELAPLLQPFASEQMKMHPVSTYVNNVRHTEAKCIEPVETLF